LRESHLVPFWDYHGSYTSWPKETYDISRGLKRQGFPRLAEELDNRLLNSCKAAHGYPEFFYVDKRGRVLGASKSSHGHDELAFVDSPIKPESVQAWTVSAVLAITHYKKQKNTHTKSDDWQKKLESEVLATLPHMPLLNSSKELSARYPAYNYRLAERERD
jgi:glycogen debranching enzyme